MTTYNTGNPLGSAAAKDLYDNAQNFDHLSNDRVNETWDDRFGKPRLTWHGIEESYKRYLISLGLNPVGSFQNGATINTVADIIQDETTNVWYLWDDIYTLPKIVPAGSTPESTGGVSEGAWQIVNFKAQRSLRVPEAYVAPVPALAERKNKSLEFNDEGNPVCVEPVHQSDLEAEATARQAGDAALQEQLNGTNPPMGSAFSPISWHDQVIPGSINIPANKNAWSFGPTITIAPGQSVTVGDGSFWTIANGQVQP